MSSFRLVMLRFRAIFRRRSLDDDMQMEMRQHLERTTERLIARGLSPADARVAAKREFGNVTVLQEEGRDARGARWMDELSGDLRFAGRYFARHKATVAIIVAVIALATGANMMIFSIFQSEFVRPAPAVPTDAAQVRIWAQERATRTARLEQRGFTYTELGALAAHRDIFRDLAAWTKEDVVLQTDDSAGARSVRAQFVTPNYFAVLGVGLVGGQGMNREAAAAPDLSAVMSYEIATQLYGTAAKAIGLTIRVNEVPVHVVGVAPPRFQGAVRHMDGSALWIPLSARADVERLSRRWLTDEPVLSLFGRLAPNTSHARATALTRQLVASTLPDSATRVGMTRTADVRGMQDLPPGEGTSELLIAFTAIAMIGLLILLVAWTNVSSLMVAAAVGRRHEIAVRLSLGASRTRLIRQLVTESTALALTGGAIGLLLAWLELSYMAKTEIDAVEILPDFSTFGFTLGIALATGILFGLSPALHATRDGVATALRDAKAGSAGRSRLQRNFVAAQIMLSQPLLVLIGVMLSLLIADYRPLAREMSRHVIDIRFRPLERASVPPSQRREAVEALLPRLAERPEVLVAVPASEGFAVRGLMAPDRPAGLTSDTAKTIVNVEGAAPGWFSLVDVPIVLGRDVSLADTAAADYPVVIGSDLARAVWGDAHPVGRTLASPPLPGFGQDSIRMIVVGVYDAGKRLPGMSWNGQATRGNMNNTVTRIFTARGKQWRHEELLVRTRGPAEPFLTDMQRYIRAAAPALPVSSIQTLAQQDDSAYHDTVRTALLAAAGGVIALLLASLGLYGVVALAVQQRIREIGIRIAVGAAPIQVARMFLASGIRVSVAALLVGLPLSLVALRVGLSQGIILAPDVNVWPIGIAIGLLLLAVASAATWVPARRASRVDPSTTLRVD